MLLHFHLLEGGTVSPNHYFLQFVNKKCPMVQSQLSFEEGKKGQSDAAELELIICYLKLPHSFILSVCKIVVFFNDCYIGESLTNFR